MRILLVDDDKVLRKLYERLLEQLGHTPYVCESGEEACRVLRETDERFDAVWTDLMMPGVDGFEVLRTARAHHPGAPVMIVSGYDESGNLVRALRAGAANFLAKPFHRGELVEALGRLDEVHSRHREERGVWKSIRSAKLEFNLPPRLEAGTALGRLLRQHFLGFMPEGEAQGLHVAVNEILANSIEHGCLGITREEKAAALIAGTWRDLVAEREASVSEDRACVRVTMTAQRGEMVQVQIEDGGPGFEPGMLRDPSEPENLLLPSGRGIFLARLHVSELRFAEGGRKAILVQDLREAPPAAH